MFNEIDPALEYDLYLQERQRHSFIVHLNKLQIKHNLLNVDLEDLEPHMFLEDEEEAEELITFLHKKKKLW